MMALIDPVKWMKIVFFVPQCSMSFSKKTMEYTLFEETQLTPANKDFVPECQGLVLCDSSGSKRRSRALAGKTMRLRCVNFQLC